MFLSGCPVAGVQVEVQKEKGRRRKGVEKEGRKGEGMGDGEEGEGRTAFMYRVIGAFSNAVVSVCKTVSMCSTIAFKQMPVDDEFENGHTVFHTLNARIAVHSQFDDFNARMLGESCDLQVSVMRGRGVHRRRTRHVHLPRARRSAQACRQFLPCETRAATMVA